MKAAVLMILLASAACSGEQSAPVAPAAETRPATPPPPAAQEARDLIERAPEFGEYQFTNAAVTLPVDGARMSEPVRQMARQLADAKWIALDGADRVVLTARSRDDRRFLMRQNGILDIVPLAKKEMADVRAVTRNADGTASVDFTWRWVANDVGQAFTSGPIHERFTAVHEARATLIWDGSSWSVLSIDEQRSAAVSSGVLAPLH